MLDYILQILRYPKRVSNLVWAGLVAAVLTACGTVTPTVEANDTDGFDFITTITIDATVSQAQLEAESGGTVIVFRPEAGFAILGMSEDAVDSNSEFSTAKNDTSTGSDTSVESNTDTFFMPEVAAHGFSSWNGGFSSWNGGFSSWNGGFSSWSGGFSSWSGGSPEPTTFGENLPIWDQINLPEAQVMAPNMGAGVKIAVIDTGIDLNHPAFEGKLARASEWMDFVDGDAYPMDEAGGAGYGHGTGVAGVIVQVAPNVTILPIRVLGTDGSGDSTDVVAAVDWAIVQGADAINLSLGSNVEVEAFLRMLEYAAEMGVPVITSAGNSGDENVTYPAAYSASSGKSGELSVGVGSVDGNDVKSVFSTYGKDLEMMAPGEDVYTLVPDERVGYWSGTSFAAPMVAGVLALGMGEHLYDRIVKMVKDLGKSATVIDDVNDRIYAGLLGDGRLDAEAFFLLTYGKQR